MWKAWALLKVKLFIWLAVWNRCWTADRLARRGLQHPDKCVLCDQDEEDIDHLLVRCSFSRQVWQRALQLIGRDQLSPGQHEVKFTLWWRRAHMRADPDCRKGLNSLIQLVAWLIWKHRNRTVFDGTPPDIQSISREIIEEANLWAIAGARALRRLL